MLLNIQFEKSKNSFGINSFILHILAMTFMLSDHLWGVGFVQQDIFTAIGRIAFPIFAFMTVEGFFRTGNIRKYCERLLIFALISEIPFNLMLGRMVFYPVHQNVLWTFLLGMGMMVLFERIKKKSSGFKKILLYPLVILLFAVLAMLLSTDYNGGGILFIAIFYFTYTKPGDKPAKKFICGAAQLFGTLYICEEIIKGLVLSFTVFGMDFEIHRQSFAVLALPLIWLYNGKQGPYNKYIRALYYWFYPLHMLILGLIAKFIW